MENLKSLPKLNISQHTLKSILTDPVLSEDTYFLFFTDSRDPTQSEPVVTATGIPAGWRFFWFNELTNEWFVNKVNEEDELIWGKIIDDKNLLTILKSEGWKINTSRVDVDISDPEFDTVYDVGDTDEEITVIFGLNANILAPAQANLLINSGTGYIVRGTALLSGIVATEQQTISKIIPAGSLFKFHEQSGTASIISVSRLSL